LGLIVWGCHLDRSRLTPIVIVSVGFRGGFGGSGSTFAMRIMLRNRHVNHAPE